MATCCCLLLWLLVFCGVHTFFSSIKQVEIFPQKDQFVPVGRNVTLYCNYKDLGNSLPANTGLYFKRNGDLMSSTPVNDTTIKIELHSKRPQSDVYLCLLNTSFSFETVDIVSVTYGYPPLAPTKGACVSEDFQNLVCSYEVPPEKNVPLYSTFWNLLFSPENFIGDVNMKHCFRNSCKEYLTYPCKCQVHTFTPERIICKIEPIGTCFFRNRTYDFQLTGANQFGFIRKNFSVTTNCSIVKLLKLTDLQVLPVNKSSLKLTWTLPRSLLSLREPVQYRVWYTPQSSPEVFVTDVKLNSSDPLKIELVNLTSGTLYQITMQHKLLSSQFWSDTTSLNGSTLSSGSGLYSAARFCGRMILSAATLISCASSFHRLNEN